MFRVAHNNIIRTVINGHASVTYVDWGFMFSQLVLEYGRDFKGLHKLKCLKQATENLDQRMRQKACWMRPRCRDVLPLLHLWPNEPKSVHLDVLGRRSNRRLSWEKLLASGPENVTDGTDLWGYDLVKSTSCSHTSQSHSCFGSWGPCSYRIWSFFWRGKSVLTLWSQCQSDSVRKMLQHWHCNVQL